MPLSANGLALRLQAGKGHTNMNTNTPSFGTTHEEQLAQWKFASDKHNEVKAERDALKAQNAELVEALKMALKGLNNTDFDGIVGAAKRGIVAALSKEKESA